MGSHAADVSIYVEAVHRLNDLGAVVTQVANGTSQEGFDAEWRGINLLTVDGDLSTASRSSTRPTSTPPSRASIELSRPAPQLKNAVAERIVRLSIFAARDWNAMDESFADDVFHDDRRRVVDAGVRRGRDAVKEDLPVLPTSASNDHVDGHRSPRRAPHPHSFSRLGPRSDPSSDRCPSTRRDRRRRNDRGAHHLRLRRHSTPPSRNSTTVTSPAKQPPMRIRGRSSCRPSPLSIGTNSSRRRPTGSLSTTDGCNVRAR